jgi:plastocyanin
VNPGTTINYNGAFSSHPLVAGTFNNGKQPANGGPIPSTSSGTTVAVTFNTNGTYPYYCDIHASSGMFGVVYVGNQCAGQSSPAGTHYLSFVAVIGAGFVALLF